MRRWLGVALGVVFVLAVSWKVLFGYIVQWQAESYFRQSFGAEFVCETVHFDGMTVVIEKPSLQSEGVTCAAKCARVNLQFWPFEYRLDLHVEEPHLEAPQLSFRISELFSEEGALFDFLTSISFVNGRAALSDSKLICSKFYADKDGGVNLTLAFDDPSLQENLLVLEGEARAYQMSVTNFDCAIVTAMIQSIDPSFRAFLVKKGSVSGHLDLRKKGHYFGELQLNGLEVEFPSEELALKVPKVLLELQKGEGGALKIVEPAEISLMREGELFWQAREIVGELQAKEVGFLALKVDGKSAVRGEQAHFCIEGGGRLFGSGKRSVELLITTEQEGVKTVGQAKIDEVGGRWSCLELTLDNMTGRQLHLAQTFFGPWVEVTEGNLFLEAKATLEGGLPRDLKVTKLAVSNLSCQLPRWQMQGSNINVTGELSLDLTHDNPMETLVSRLQVNGGSVVMFDEKGPFWELTGIDTTLFVKRGVVQNSLVKAALLGMEGSIAVDFSKGDKLMELEFKGALKQLVPLLPNVIAQGIQQGFNDDLVAVVGGVFKRDEKVEVEGQLQVSREGASEIISFGFQLEQAASDLYRPSRSSKLTDWHRLSVALLEASTPPEAQLALAAYQHWMEREAGVGGWVLRDGWFQAYNIPLAKYVTPFIFSGEEEAAFVFSGRGDLMGMFDHTGLSLNYNVHDLSLESGNFLIEIDEIVHADEMSRQAALHYVDFKSGATFGVVPINHGSYLEKNSGLLFEEVSATVFFHGNNVHVANVDTYCMGAHFSGEIDVNCSFPDSGAFDVTINIEAMQGKVKHLQDLYSQFNMPSCFLTFPLDGTFFLKERGGALSFKVRPDLPTKIETAFHAGLIEGSCTLAPLDLSLRELELEIAYSSAEDSLRLSGIQGTLLVGKPEEVEEYLFNGDEVFFDSLSCDSSRFDLWVGSSTRDIMRIAGTSHALEESGHVAITLDRTLSHFGKLYPEKVEVTLANWVELAHLRFDATFELSTLFSDLKRLGRSGVFFFPDALLAKINALELAEGAFTMSLRYEAEQFNCSLKGCNFLMGTVQSDEVLFEGHLRDRFWSIEELRFDRLSLASEIERLEDRWKVNCLAVRFGDHLLAGVSGEYCDEEGCAELNLNRLEVDMAALSHLHPLLKEYSIKGKLKAEGKLSLEKSDGERGVNCDMIASVALKDWTVQALRFSDTEAISCHVILDKNLTLRQLKTSLLSGSSGEKIADLFVDCGTLDFTRGAIECDAVHFSLPAESAAEVVDAAKMLLGELITPQVMELLTALKEEGRLEGRVAYQQGALGPTYQVTLAPGVYNYCGMAHHVKSFSLDATSTAFHILTEYIYNEECFFIETSMPFQQMNKGVLMLSSMHPGSAQKHRLQIDWEVDQERFFVQKISGALAGCEVQLQRDPATPQDCREVRLVGTVEALLPRAYRLLQRDVAAAFTQQNMGGLWRFQGKWAVDPSKGLSFTGNASGSEPTFRNYQFEKAYGFLQYGPQEVEMRDWHIVDLAGKIDIPRMSIYCRGENPWQFAAPKVMVTNLRPWILREPNAPAPQSKKPLVITTLELNDFSGFLANEASYCGSGKLHFTNSSKSILKNQLFAIPAEIITRIGLNPSVLTPAEGGITYEVHDGKIFLTKFKDVYSDGKASKFYLPNRQKESSYIDFVGNVNVQLRMKQYNILFKLTEPFVVSIKGTLTKPTYSLHAPSRN